jgi:hypothetical protein
MPVINQGKNVIPNEVLIMNFFESEILSMTDVTALHKMKEEIKDTVTSSDLNWQSRMVIYQQVQMIISRIEFLEKHSMPT